MNASRRSPLQRVVSAIMAAVLVCGLTPAGAWAAPNSAMGGGADSSSVSKTLSLNAKGLQTQAAGDWTGSGTQVDPYVISDAAGLQKLATNVNGGTAYTDTYFKLGNDIDLSSISNWTPIGYNSANISSSTNSYKPFKGVFDGDYKTITGLSITSQPDNGAIALGLFGAASDATIKNLVVQGSINLGEATSITGGDLRIAGIVARADNTVTLINVGNEVAITHKVTGTSYNGGLVGGAVGSVLNMSGCYNSANITAYSGRIGGLVGAASGANAATWKACYNAGNIEKTGGTSLSTTVAIGGIAGVKANTVTMSGCYNYGQVITRGSNNYYGTLVGNPGNNTTDIFSGLYYVSGKLLNGENDNSVLYDYPFGSSSRGTLEEYATGVSSAGLNSADTITAMNTAAGQLEGKDAFKRGTDYPLLYWEAAGNPIIADDGQPQGYVVTAGETATALTVTALLPEEGSAGSNGTLSYQWQESAHNANEFENIAGATDAGYTPDVSVAGVTDYRCIVTNTFTPEGATEALTPSATSEIAVVNVQDANEASTPTVTVKLISGKDLKTPVDAAAVSEVGQADDVYLYAAISGLTYTDGTVSYVIKQTAPDATMQDIEGESTVSTEYGVAAVVKPINTDTLGANTVQISVKNTYQLTKTATTDATANFSIGGKTIETADELADFATAVNNGTTYEGMTVTLTANIDMSTLSTDKTFTPIGKDSSHPFKGEFAGGRHTINNLIVNETTEQRAGLFASTDGAKIHDLELGAGSSITGTRYVGGIVGYANGETEISKVANHAKVEGTENYTGYSTGGTGGIIGYAGNAHVKVSQSYNDAEIKGAGSVGGIIGSAASGLDPMVTVEDCYNLGAITGTTAPSYYYGVSGIVGLAETNIAISNCYNAGKVSAPASDRGYGAIVWTKADQVQNCTFENNYWLEGTSDRSVSYNNSSAGFDATNALASKCQKVTAADLMPAYTALDGSAARGVWRMAPVSYHSGYPALGWETIPDAYKGIFTAPDNIDTANLHIAVPVNSITVIPVKQADGTFMSYFENGTYTYTAKLFGYEDQTGTFTVNNADTTIPLNAFTTAATQEVMFNVKSGETTIQNPAITVKNADGTTMLATNDVYALPAGTYTYTVAAKGYISKTDTFTVADATVAVTVQLDPLPAQWDGVLIAEPSQEEGVYQIGHAAELAWLSQEVNAGKLATPVNAVLTADIDLNSKAWTPIGTADKPFVGTFDGKGYVVENLANINSTANKGLFANVGNATTKSTIKNVTVTGAFAVSGNYASGGLVGEMVNTAVENCGSSVKVSNAPDTNKGTGGLIGLVSAGGASSITGCRFDGLVDGGGATSNDGSNLGGIIGYNAAADLNITSCYSVGTTNKMYHYAGGIIGNASAATSLTNCYSLHTFGKSGSNAGILAGYGAANYTFTNCYYAVGDSKTTAGVNASTDPSGVTKVDAATDLASDTVLSALGNNFVSKPWVNNGIPTLAWEKTPNAAKVTFTSDNFPEDVTITLKKGEADAIQTTKNVAADTTTYNAYIIDSAQGTYTYTATAYGYETKTGTVEVASEDVTQALGAFVESAKQTVTFAISYSDNATDVTPTITVTNNRDATVAANENGTYSLPSGTFTYTVKAKGYVPQSGEFTVANAAQTVEVTLPVVPAWDGEMLLQPELTDGVFQVGNAQELAFVAAVVNQASGSVDINIKLTDDIDLNNKAWTPIGNNSTNYYRGTFDGNGHTVSGLKVEGSKTYAGLFGNVKGTYANNVVIKNLIVKGKVDPTSSYNTVYVAGVAGQSTYATFENVGNEATVSYSSSYYASHVGGITGYIESGASFTDCYNKGAISFTGSASTVSVGGIAGYNSSSSTLTNCYNNGTITASKNAGGLVGNAYSSYTARNCYASGAVMSSSSSGIISGYSSWSTPTFTNCYYAVPATSTAVTAVNGSSSDAAGITKVNSNADITPAALGNAYQAAVTYFNEGAPSLAWETLPPAAKLTITVVNAPNDTLITLKKDNSDAIVVSKQDDGTFAHYFVESAQGTYTYTASAYGYQDLTGTITIGAENVEETIGPFFDAPKQPVAFSVTNKDETVTISDYSIDVLTELGKSIPNSGTFGLYNLVTSTTHRYAIEARGYAPVTGTFTTDATVGSIKIIAVTLDDLPEKWDGENSYAPLTDEDGVYQVSNAYELAWIAKNVNSGTLENVNAVLTADIDLNSKAWTPIGTADNPFVGTFDGKGHVVENLASINSTANKGLFANVGNATTKSTIKNVAVTGAFAVSGNYASGGLVGEMVNTAVENCGSSVKVSNAPDTNKGTGGLIGLVSAGGASSITGCRFDGLVDGANTGDGSNLGGIVGYNAAADLNITSCYSVGTTNKMWHYAGGIIGNASAATLLKNCYSLHTFGKSGSNAGILGGYGAANYTFTNCYYAVGDSKTTAGVNASTDPSGVTKVDAATDITAAKLGSAFVSDRVFVEGSPLLSWESLTDKIALNNADLTLKVADKVPCGIALDVTGIYNDYEFAVDTKHAIVAFYEDEEGTTPIQTDVVPKGTSYAKLTATDDGDFTGESVLIKVTAANYAPELAQDVAATATAKQFARLDYTLDLSSIFVDKNNDDLTYKVSINDEDPVSADASYSFETPTSGDTKFVFTANDGTVDSSATYTVTLSVREETQETVSYTAQAAGAFLKAPQFNVKVSNRAAEDRGFTDDVEGVSALDVLVAAHQAIFGAEDFAASPNDYLIVNDSGYITKIFGEVTSYCGFAINGEAPADKTQTFPAGYGMPESYLGLGVTQAPVEDGDFVEFFIYQNSYLLDYYAWFANEDDRIDALTGIEAVAGEPLELDVKGYWFGYYSLAVSEALRDGSALDAEDLSVVVIDSETGAASEFSPAVAVDEDGVASVTFAIPGTYLLALQGDEYKDIISSLAKVTVSARPKRADGVATAATVEQFAGLDYKLNLADIFEDADNDTLTYTVSVNGGAAQAADQDYTYTMPDDDSVTLVFKASDGTLESTDTYTVTLTKRAEVTANVNYTAQAAGAFLVAPQFNVKVSNRAAEDRGFTDDVEGVSALDVLVAAHQAIFGAEDFAASPNDYLIVNDSGYITKIFGEVTSYCGFAINGEAPADKTKTIPAGYGMPESYLGLGVTQAPVADNDFVEFFIFQNSYLLDNYAWFANEDGRIDALTGIEAVAGEPLELDVKGYWFGYYSLAVSETFRDGSARDALDAEDLPVVLINSETGAASEFSPAVAVDEDGVASVTFATPGTYLLALQGDEDTKIIASLAKVTVKPLDAAREALKEAAEAAEEVIANVDAFSADGTDVTTDKTWNSPENKTALEDAIAQAKVIAQDDTATGARIAEARDALSDELAKFQDAVSYGTLPLATDAQRREATKTTYNAERLLDTVMISEDGLDMDEGDVWAPYDKVMAVKNAAKKVSDLLDQASLAGSVLDEATADLTDAVTALKAARKAESRTKYNQLSGVVYASVANDGKFVVGSDQDATVMANVPIDLAKVSAIDLDDYGFGNFKHVASAANATYKYEASALQLAIYLHENYCADSVEGLQGYDSDPEGTYGVAHTFGTSKFWNANAANFTYAVNGYQGPSTMDSLPLQDGDTIEFILFAGPVSTWNAETSELTYDANAGYLFFYESASKAYDEMAVKLMGIEAEQATFNVRKTVTAYQAETELEVTTAVPVQDVTVSYGKVYGTALGTAKTDASGNVTLTMPAQGTYCMWVDGIKGATFTNYAVSSPAYVQLEVVSAQDMPASAEEATQLSRDLRTANRLLNSVVPSSDGTDVDENELWASDADIDALDIAVRMAGKTLANNEATAGEVEQARSALAAAQAALQEAVKSGTKPSTETKDAFAESITAAKQTDTTGVSDDAKTALEEAIAAAEKVAADPAATTTQIAQAQAAINDALTAVATAKEAADAEAAKAVADAIAALPDADKVTAADAEKVTAAQQAFDKLTDAQKALIPSDAQAKLNAAKTAVDKAVSDAAATGLSVGKAFTVTTTAGKFTYKVTAEKQVTLTKAASTKKNGALTISTVSYQGTTYQVTAIGAKAFKAAKLKKIVVDKGVKTIGAQAFLNAKQLTTFTVGKDVAKIGAKAFKGAKKLKKVTVKSTYLVKKSNVKNALKASKVTNVKTSGLKGKVKKNTVKAFKQAGKKGVKVK